MGDGDGRMDGCSRGYIGSREARMAVKGRSSFRRVEVDNDDA